MSKRQDIVTAIAARLATITTAGGYATNIGQKVYEWRITPLDDASLPCVTFRDGPASVEVVAHDKLDHLLTVEVEAYFKGAAADARNALADIARAMEVDTTWGGLALTTDLTSHEPTVEQEGDKVSAGRIECHIRYRTARGTT